MKMLNNQTVTKIVATAAMAFALSGCSGLPDIRVSDWFSGDETPISVTEVARHSQCGAKTAELNTHIFRQVESLKLWESERGIEFLRDEPLQEGNYAVVELGQRNTGGYGLAVSRQAALRGSTVILNTTFLSPRPGSMRTQALTSPCVLVALPQARIKNIEVRNEAGTVVAQTK